MRSAACQRKWKHKESGGEQCLHEEKINVESWGKQAGREEQTLPGADYLQWSFIHTATKER